ncbi:MAG: hypothetical protein N4A35_16660 [Flavobacteriales bacterium]|nr:hypothetical protein [Flavobacteriales bacterium]
MKRFNITISLIFIYNLITFSQTDTIVRKSLFSENSDTTEVFLVNRVPKPFKNVFSYDLLGITWGERKISYDRLITKYLAINFSAGYTKEDLIYNMSNAESIYEYSYDFLDGEASHRATLGYMYSFGIKRYLKTSFYGTYISPVISIAEYKAKAYKRLNGSYKDDYDFTDEYNVNNRSITDFKVELGYIYYSDKHFFWNANVAAGLRKSREQFFSEIDTYPQTYTYIQNDVSTLLPLITFGFKIGIAF